MWNRVGFYNLIWNLQCSLKLILNGYQVFINQAHVLFSWAKTRIIIADGLYGNSEHKTH